MALEGRLHELFLLDLRKRLVDAANIEPLAEWILVGPAAGKRPLLLFERRRKKSRI